MDPVPTYVLDGSQINSLENFWTVIGEAVNGPGGYFANSLDALNDSLSGGMGTPIDGRCRFVWQHVEHSRRALGYTETVRQLELRLERCHPTNRQHVRADLGQARACVGPTAYDWLFEIFAHSPADLIVS